MLFDVLLIVASLFFGNDDRHHNHCGTSWGRGSGMGLMILIPLVLVGALLLYGYHSAYLDSPPKRVFISDVDGSKDSRTVAKGPVAHKSVAKAHSTAHKTAAKHHSTTHQVAHHAN